MQLYATRMDGEIPAQDWQELCSLIPEYRQGKIRLLLVRQDRERSLLAGLLLRHAIRETLGEESVHFEFNSCGKPALAGRSDFHFSLSHAGIWIVCAVDGQSVGVDVEKTETVDFPSLARVAFSLEEQRTLQNKIGAEQLDYFYDVWTMKESYCKAVGQGLSLAPETLTVKAGGLGQWIIAPRENPGWRLHQYKKIETGYKLAVCALHESFTEDMHLIPWRSLR